MFSLFHLQVIRAKASSVRRTRSALSMATVERSVYVTTNIALASDLLSVVAITERTATTVNFGSGPASAAPASNDSTMADALKVS